MSNSQILEQKNLTKKSNKKIFQRVYDEYTESEIKALEALYDNNSFNYGLTINEGDKVVAKVVGETLTDYLFDIGYKDYIHVEKRKSENDALAKYAVDDNVSFNTEVEILITEVSEKPYLLRGSIASLQKNDMYSDILSDNDLVLDAYVAELLPAGYTIEIYHNGYKIPAFMPNILAGLNKLTTEQTNDLVGKNVEVMVESFSSEKGTFIVSRKKYLKSLIPQAIEKLAITDVDGNLIEYTGVVTGSTKFGIFVEFNECLTSMIHKDNLNDSYKNNYQNIQAGTEIKFFIKEIIKDKVIPTQVIKETLWDTVKKDSEYVGKVCDEKSFGLLVRLDEETVGLIHTSELEKMSVKPTIGTTLKVKVIFVQKMERKIYLTIVK